MAWVDMQRTQGSANANSANTTHALGSDARSDASRARGVASTDRGNVAAAHEKTDPARVMKPAAEAVAEDDVQSGDAAEPAAEQALTNTFLTDGWKEIGGPSGLTAAELETLAHGLPPAEHTLASLCEAESQSAQLEALQLAWSAPGRPVPVESISGILGRLNKAGSKPMQLLVLQHAAAKLAGFAALDAAVRPLFVPGPQFQHAGKLVLRATALGLKPGAFAELLDGLMAELGCFLSAAQARELVLSAAPTDEAASFWHIACCRVVDRWNVTESLHGAGVCDYGWDGEYTLKLAASCGTRPTQVALRSRVLVAVGRGDPLHARSLRVAECAARIIATNTGAGSSS